MGVASVPKVCLTDGPRARRGWHGSTQSSAVQSWREWQAGTERVTAASSLPSPVSATQIAHPTTPVHEAAQGEYRSAGLLFARTPDEVGPPAVGSSESG